MKLNDSLMKSEIMVEIPWIPLNAPIQSSQNERSPELYMAIIKQFRVEINHRYTHRDGKTYCNIFAWDVTRAMSAEIPHWANSAGVPCSPDSEDSNRMNCNAMWRWLHTVGDKYGWHKIDMPNAINSANNGCPTIGIYHNTSGNGHVAILRPYCTLESGPSFAQAGKKCFLNGTINDAFADKRPEFWTNN